MLIAGHNVVPLKLLSSVVPHAKRGLSFAQVLWLQGVASEELAGTPEAAGFLLGEAAAPGGDSSSGGCFSGIPQFFRISVWEVVK